MSKLTFLEDFSTGAGRAPENIADRGASSDDLQASFDEGYKCGWQDGTSATESHDLEIRDGLSSALQALNFTYFEARQHAMQSLRPVLEAMTDTVLPLLLSKSLGGRVIEILEEVSETIEPSVTIICAPESEEMLKELVMGEITFPVTIEAEASLTSSQAILHLNDGQTNLDLSATLDSLRDCVSSFFEEPELKEAEHA